MKGNGESLMLMDAPPPHENIIPFIKVGEHLSAKGFNAPKIYAKDIENGFLLLEDLGEDSFTRLLSGVLSKGAVGESVLYTEAVNVLIELSKQELPENIPYYTPALYMREVQLLVDWYMPHVEGIAFLDKMKQGYLEIWEKILAQAALPQDTLVLRDYHADNLMWLPDREGIQRVGLLDFQDAVIGSALYDLVSLLEDARRDVMPHTVDAVIEHYLAACSPKSTEQFKAHYAILAAQRNCKIIGIFSRLAVRDKKERYLQYLPRVWGHLDRDLSHPALAELKRWFSQVMDIKHRELSYFKIPAVKGASA
jgi:N-acetylmuramate 1-kinase